MKEKTGKALVVGAGPGGIRAALDLAGAGFSVILAERSDRTGGGILKLDVQFPTTTCGFCRMLPVAGRDKGSQHCLRRGLTHENIDLRLNTTLLALDGEPGAFTASLAQDAPLLDPEKCMGCGICETVCPVSLPDAFNQGLTSRKAVGRPCPQSFPNAYSIDPEACTRCGACATACPTHAVTLSPGNRAAFNILVVDDEAIVRDSMKEWLSLEGYRVATAGSAAEALAALTAEDFRLMLTDIKMPGMDGVELLTRAREINPDLTVIMMTAYAEVDSAVTAMKEGALDYVTKPFEPEKITAMVDTLYQAFRSALAVKETVDVVILATGTGFFTPDQEKNLYGSKDLLNVVTALAFERMLSPEGPRGLKEGDRIAWLQCVGSRTRDRSFCSSVCCMISLKQALMAKTRLPGAGRADIFYMDLRTTGKDYDRYRKEAEAAGVGLVRARIHSIAPMPTDRDGGTPIVLRYAEQGGRIREREYDWVVLATGQEQSEQTAALIRLLDLDTDEWGFIRPHPFDADRTSRPGILCVGGPAGFKDIETTVVFGSAAALDAARIMEEAAGPRSTVAGSDAGVQEEGEEPGVSGSGLADSAPKVHLLVCTCTEILGKAPNLAAVKQRFAGDPAVTAVDQLDGLCTPEGLEAAKAAVMASGANRLVVGGCAACTAGKTLAWIGQAAGLPRRLVRGLDLLSMAGHAAGMTEDAGTGQGGGRTARNGFAGWTRKVLEAASRAVWELKAAAPAPSAAVPEFNRALVIGGGIAGMTAALGIAGAGFGVDLVEASPALGGQLTWLRQTATGDTTAELLAGLTESVLAHVQISVHLSAQVSASSGRPGRWTTVLSPSPGSDSQGSSPEGGRQCRVSHGVVVLATGGTAAGSEEEGPGIYTQKTFQKGLDDGGIDPAALKTLVMVQCRDCRDKEKNYCSVVCCPRALYQALTVKEGNPKAQVFVLYRDMMTPGNLEGLYTRAREAGIVFIPYDRGQAPGITPGGPDGNCLVDCHDPILGRGMEISADAVVLSTGVEPTLSQRLAGMFSAQLDTFGFFKAADPKWRPVEGCHPRVMACGLALSPCDLSRAAAQARACAIRAAGILSGAGEGAAARVKAAYCSLCLACIPACPFNARSLDEENAAIVVDGQACQGCGICASVCPSKAARVDGGERFLEIIGAVLVPPA